MEGWLFRVSALSVAPVFGVVNDDARTFAWFDDERKTKPHHRYAGAEIRAIGLSSARARGLPCVDVLFAKKTKAFATKDKEELARWIDALRRIAPSVVISDGLRRFLDGTRAVSEGSEGEGSGAPVLIDSDDSDNEQRPKSAAAAAPAAPAAPAAAPTTAASSVSASPAGAALLSAVPVTPRIAEATVTGTTAAVGAEHSTSAEKEVMAEELQRLRAELDAARARVRDLEMTNAGLQDRLEARLLDLSASSTFLAAGTSPARPTTRHSATSNDLAAPLVPRDEFGPVPATTHPPEEESACKCVIA